MKRTRGGYESGPTARIFRYPLQLAGLAATLVALIASEGVAQAAPATLSAGPVKVHGYQMFLSASGAKGGSPSLQVSMVRTAHSSTQQHLYTFTLKRGALKIAADLGSATLKTGQLSGFGSITMQVVRPGKLTKITACGVVGNGRRGTLRGSLRLVLDRSFFRTVKLQTMPALLVRSSRSGTCGGQPPTKPGAGALSLSAAAGPNAATFLVTKGATGLATMMSTRSELVKQVRILHQLITKAPGSAFTAASDLSTAHVDGNAAAPLFGGALDFTPSAPAQHTGKCTMAFGSLGGSLTAHFDSIGSQSIGGTATIIRC